MRTGACETQECPAVGHISFSELFECGQPLRWRVRIAINKDKKTDQERCESYSLSCVNPR